MRQVDGWLLWSWNLGPHVHVQLDLATWTCINLSVCFRRPRWLAISIGPLYIDISSIEW